MACLFTAKVLTQDWSSISYQAILNCCMACLFTAKVLTQDWSSISYQAILNHFFKKITCKNWRKIMVAGYDFPVVPSLRGDRAPPNDCLCLPPHFGLLRIRFETARNDNTTGNNGKRNAKVQTYCNSCWKFSPLFTKLLATNCCT